MAGDLVSIIKSMLTAAALTVTAQGAVGQDITLRLAHVAPTQTTYQSAAERFAANLSEMSGGTMAVDIIPGALDLHLIDLAATIAIKGARPFPVLWSRSCSAIRRISTATWKVRRSSV